ncbi:MAG: hypothetical protein ACXQTP_02875 [Candidatus Methanofastidiosia archaeon]
MRWDKVGSDAYYKAREFEFIAKRFERVGEIDKARDCWENFSQIKVEKGSYLLAAYGYRHVSRLFQMARKEEKSINAMIKSRDCASKADSDIYFFISNELAFILEMTGRLKDALDCCEEVGSELEKAGKYFLAADAYEHAAELRYRLGMPTRDYSLPIDAWRKNATYWQEKGESDDAEWSKERKRYYKTLFRQ